jgi:hypothetical protein
LAKTLRILGKTSIPVFGIVLAIFFIRGVFSCAPVESPRSSKGGDFLAEQFALLAEIGKWPFYWPIIGLGVLIGIALLLYEIVDRFLAQRRGELCNKLQWDDGYIERISKAFKNKETTRDQKIEKNDGAEVTFVEHTKTERMGVL